MFYLTFAYHDNGDFFSNSTSNDHHFLIFIFNASTLLAYTYFFVKPLNSCPSETRSLSFKQVSWIEISTQEYDLMAFKTEFGHCNVPKTRPRNNKYYSLGIRCCHVRMSYKGMGRKLSKADIQRIENAGFEWNLCKKSPFERASMILWWRS